MRSPDAERAVRPGDVKFRFNYEFFYANNSGNRYGFLSRTSALYVH